MIPKIKKTYYIWAKKSEIKFSSFISIILLRQLSSICTALVTLTILSPLSIAQQSKQLHTGKYATIKQVAQVATSKNSGAWIARHGMSSSQYQSEFDEYADKGYRLKQVSGYGIGNEAYYAAIWEKDNGSAYIARHGMTSSQYQSEFNQHTQNGYRLVLVDGYSVGNEAYYAAIWEKGNGSAYIARHGMTSSQYQSEFNQHVQNGYRLTHVSGYNVGSEDFYAAIWEKKEGNYWAARHRMTSKNYQCEFDNYYYQGYRPKLVSGYTKGKSAHYAAIWESTGAWEYADIQHIDETIKSFMETNQVPGAALAITKDGQLVFAKGYGYADKEKGEKTCATNLFRIASVSKPITSVAIMKLVEEGKLKLSSKVFGSGAILGNAYGSKSYSARERAITIAQLLEHTAGGNEWDNNTNPVSDRIGDPTYSKTSYKINKLISWVLDNQKIDAVPGSIYNYSNIGYSILGRIIEKVAGKPYQSYLLEEILKPIGVKDMHIAGDKKSQKRPNEVIYYDDNAYKWPVSRRDSHGGWIASPVDLMRFMVRVDNFDTKSDILESSTIKSMTTSTLKNGYAKGWQVNSSKKWGHSGLLEGTRSAMFRTNDGYCWALLVNSSNDDDTQVLETTMREVINGIENWPSHDLF